MKLKKSEPTFENRWMMHNLLMQKSNEKTKLRNSIHVVDGGVLLCKVKWSLSQIYESVVVQYYDFLMAAFSQCTDDH